MQITLKSNTRDLEEIFIYEYLPRYIYKYFLDHLDAIRIKEFDNFFDTNFFEILSKAIKNLLITKNGMYEYNIKINKILKYDGISLTSWLEILSYGNREIKGYPIMLDIFKHISEDIQIIYEE